MKTWIITGGVGCGKSAALAAMKTHFSAKKAHFFSADEDVRRLYQDQTLLAQLKQSLGPEAVLAGQGSAALAVNRSWLRQKVFTDAAVRGQLESLLHPLVRKRMAERQAQAVADGAELFLAEVPLHYEGGEATVADLVIVVAASRTVQVRRLMERRGLEESFIEHMLRSQWPIEAKVEKADVVIWNDGDFSALEAQMLTFARQYCSQ
jgi:dephospho-CoA kinase